MAKGKKVLNSGEYIARRVPEILEQMREEKVEKYKPIVLEAFANYIASNMFKSIGQRTAGIMFFIVLEEKVVLNDIPDDKGFSIEEMEYLLPTLNEIAKELGNPQGKVYVSTPALNEESELRFQLRYNFS